MKKATLRENPFTVGDLISELQKLPADMRVMVRGYEGGYHDASKPEIKPIKVNKNEPWYYGPHDDPDKGEKPDFNAAIL